MPRSVPAAVLVALFCACAAPTVRVERSKDVNYSSFHTYGWAPAQAEARSPEDLALAQAVARALEARGLRKSDRPDLVLRAFTAWSRQTFRSVPGPRGFEAQRDPREGPPLVFPSTQREFRHWHDGTLVLEVREARGDREVWHSEAEAAITERWQEGSRARIEAAVARMLQSWPTTD